MKRIFALLAILSSLDAFPLDEIVKKEEFKLGSYTTVSGKTIPEVRFGYETYGKLNAEKSNAILIAHYFTGNSHAAGKYAASDAGPGYWDGIIGSGKALDTDKYFIIAVDSLVNLTPGEPTTITTGPASRNPKTKRPYGMGFPLVGVRDFVNVQKRLVDSLGIKKLLAVTGASGGAAQAMEYAVAFPKEVGKVIAVIGPGLSLPPYTIALLDLWSAPILLDPKWSKGQYYGKTAPLAGLTESLKLITHSSVSFDWAQTVGGGFESDSRAPLTAYEHRYAIEALLQTRGEARASKIDANSLLYMAKAIQSFNVENETSALAAEVLFIPVRSDLIFPPELSVAAARTLCTKGKKAMVSVLETTGGHLDGLLKIAEAATPITQFLNGQLKSCP